MLSISVVILTYNEEKHISRAIQSVSGLAKEIIVVDSYSDDSTREIAKSLGARVFSHAWEQNYARQFNWAIENTNIQGDWIFRLDADEYVTEDLTNELRCILCNLNSKVTGVYIRRKIVFLGRWMRFGGTYPMWVLRIWRKGKGNCESRWMDEHIVLTEGRVTYFDGHIVDENLNDLSWWTEKHNKYATREAADLLLLKTMDQSLGTEMVQEFKNQPWRKRWLKENMYARLPLFVRPLVYFLYRYILRMGILDGIPGLIWNFLQGFWYRFLVDAKIYEIKRKSRQTGKSLSELVTEEWNLK